jgi:membrane protein YdbS with pleckstrin-like domain
MDPTFPAIADGVDHPLDPRYVPLQRLRALVGSAVLGPASFAGRMALWVQTGRLMAGLVLVPLWLVLFSAVAWQMRRWPAIAYRHASYRVDDLGIEIRRGVYFREVTSVPRSRVQHTDVSQGPLERRFGLGTLVIHTAGTAHSEVTVAGLDHTVAGRIRDHLLPGTKGDAV